MNMLALTIFPAMMAFAASSDLLTMRISNRVVLILLVSFLVLALVIGMPLRQFGIHVGIASLVLVVAFAFFARGWVGGGDAKLAAATALWLGSSATIPYLMYAGIGGGILTFAILLIRRLPLPPRLSQVGWIDRIHNVSGIPYGIALAVAGLLVYPESAVFTHFIH